MKKIIVLLLTLSLLICTNAIVYATEGDDSGSEPIATVEDTSETAVESYTEEEADLTEEPSESETTAPTEEPSESEATVPTEESAVPETSNSAAESVTPETTEPKDESVAPEVDVSTVSSETSEESVGNKAEGNMQPASNAKPVSNGEILGDSPVARNATYNIKIEWKGLAFTYHEPQKGNWNPETGTYDAGENGGYWTSSDENNSNCGTITVTNNNGTVDIGSEFKVKFAFEKNSSFNLMKMRFSTDLSSVKNSTNASGELSFLEENAPNSQSIYIYPYYDETEMTAEVFEKAQNRLGTIKITIEAFEAGGNPTYPEEPGIE